MAMLPCPCDYCILQRNIAVASQGVSFFVTLVLHNRSPLCVGTVWVPLCLMRRVMPSCGEGASQTGCWHGSDSRSMHDIDASPPWWKHPLARLIDCVYDCDGMPSNGKNTTVRGVWWAPVMPTARPRNVGPCAARASCQKIDPANELHAGGEDCPGFPRTDSHGQRCTRALAVRPLQPSRAWSRRLDRRHWRRPVALLGSRTVPRTKPEHTVCRHMATAAV